jgi:hypothetical protein
MTTKRETTGQLVRWHVGRKITLHIGGFSTDGWLAMIIITIILASRFVRCTWRLVAWLAPLVSRLVLRYAAGLYLGFRAFYTH